MFTKKRTQFFRLEKGNPINIDHIADFGEYPLNKRDEPPRKGYLIKKAHSGKSGHPENVMITYNDYVGLLTLLEREGRLEIQSIHKNEDGSQRI